MAQATFNHSWNTHAPLSAYHVPRVDCLWACIDAYWTSTIWLNFMLASMSNLSQRNYYFASYNFSAFIVLWVWMWKQSSLDYSCLFDSHWFVWKLMYVLFPSFIYSGQTTKADIEQLKHHNKR